MSAPPTVESRSSSIRTWSPAEYAVPSGIVDTAMFLNSGLYVALVVIDSVDEGENEPNTRGRIGVDTGTVYARALKTKSYVDALLS